MAILKTNPSEISYLKRYNFSRQDCIPAYKDTLWIVERGAVQTLTWSDQGTPLPVGLWGSGDIVGQPLSRFDPYLMKCLTHVEATFVPPKLWNHLLDGIVLHVQQVQELLAIVRSERVHLRLQKFLIWIAHKFGCPASKGVSIDLFLTHQEIAEIIGTSRVTVTRLMEQLERAGAIAREKKRLTLLHKGFEIIPVEEKS